MLRFLLAVPRIVANHLTGAARDVAFAWRLRRLARARRRLPPGHRFDFSRPAPGPRRPLAPLPPRDLDRAIREAPFDRSRN